MEVDDPFPHRNGKKNKINKQKNIKIESMELPPVVRLKRALTQERVRKGVVLGHLTGLAGFDWLCWFHNAECRRGRSRDSICCCWLSEAC